MPYHTLPEVLSIKATSLTLLYSTLLDLASLNRTAVISSSSFTLRCYTLLHLTTLHNTRLCLGIKATSSTLHHITIHNITMHHCTQTIKTISFTLQDITALHLALLHFTRPDLSNKNECSYLALLNRTSPCITRHDLTKPDLPWSFREVLLLSSLQ